MGKRGGSSGFTSGQTTNAPATPQISEFYQNRLNQIEAAIRHEQITASLIASDSPSVRRAAQAARDRIERLEQQYDQIERIARQDAQSGIGF